jgi:tetratricopeptide (TPR) repeat protein
MGAGDYAGAQTCKDCHQAEFQAWQGSHHDWAMRHAGPDTVKGDFDNAEVTAQGVTSRMFTRDGEYFAITDGADGALTEFKIQYTFGIVPLQQYLVEFPNGRLQALPLAWDTRPAEDGGQRWFHLYPDEQIDHRDELHWTGLQQNWNYMCADCHSTGLEKNYDSRKDAFATTWKEINVACEACHGPGAGHVENQRSGGYLTGGGGDSGLLVQLHDRKGVSWPTDPVTGIATRSGPPSPGVEIQVCAACHSRRGLVAEGRESDPEFLQHHLPALLSEGLYFSDGQIDDEVYVWGSFTQSKMHEAGVTCSDCHDPHSLELRAPGDAVCAQCHLPAKFATSEHHHHPVDSAGADCLACHMPERTYMVVDPRRDHSMRIPRPDLSLQLDTPDACSTCHADRPKEWSAEVFSQWFPEPRPLFQDWGTAFDQARDNQPQAEVSLMSLANDRENPDLVRATAIQELRNYLSPLSGQIVLQGLQDDSALVRLASLRALEAMPPQNRLALARPALADPVLTVRAEAARLLVGVPADSLGPGDIEAMRVALADYVATQEYNADRPESQMNLGNLYAEMGDPAKAEKHYRLALARDSRFSPARVNLAELYRAQGLTTEGMKVIREGLDENPDDPTLHHVAGLALVRSGQSDQAVIELQKAAELAPENPRFAYVYGIALNSTGQPTEALAALETATANHPNDRNILFALATLYRDTGNPAQARKYANRLLQINPADEAALQILRELDQQ